MSSRDALYEHVIWQRALDQRHTLTNQHTRNVWAHRNAFAGILRRAQAPNAWHTSTASLRENDQERSHHFNHGQPMEPSIRTQRVQPIRTQRAPQPNSMRQQRSGVACSGKGFTCQFVKLQDNVALPGALGHVTL